MIHEKVSKRLVSFFLLDRFKEVLGLYRLIENQHACFILYNIKTLIEKKGNRKIYKGLEFPHYRRRTEPTLNEVLKTTTISFREKSIVLHNPYFSGPFLSSPLSTLDNTLKYRSKWKLLRLPVIRELVSGLGTLKGTLLIILSGTFWIKILSKFKSLLSNLKRRFVRA